MYAADARAAQMLSTADFRVFTAPEERFQRCAYCGKEVVVLPNDRRGGSCFDCLSILGMDEPPCPECGGEIPPGRRASGCARCGWTTERV